jgi:hypothetical protein
MKTLNRDFGIFKVKIANELDAIRQSEEETDEMIIAQEEEISRLKQEIYKLSGAKAQKVGLQLVYMFWNVTNCAPRLKQHPRRGPRALQLGTRKPPSSNT